jgi:hypothetical protein
MMNLNTDLAKCYAETLNAEALIEIAKWCEVAAKAIAQSDTLQKHKPTEASLDRLTYTRAANALRAIAKEAC